MMNFHDLQERIPNILYPVVLFIEVNFSKKFYYQTWLMKQG